jgi:cation:H+ antiporter
MIMTIMGIGGLVAGAKLFVYAATILAKALNISDAVIGLTVVAVGTSLPELATSVVAAVRKEQDIAIGNVIGSNIFNVLSILGIVPLISPITAVGIGCIDIIFMTALSVILYFFMLTGSKISRWEGLLLLMSYIAYTIYLLI